MAKFSKKDIFVNNLKIHSESFGKTSNPACILIAGKKQLGKLVYRLNSGYPIMVEFNLCALFHFYPSLFEQNRAFYGMSRDLSVVKKSRCEKQSFGENGLIPKTTRNRGDPAYYG